MLDIVHQRFHLSLFSVSQSMFLKNRQKGGGLRIWALELGNVLNLSSVTSCTAMNPTT